MLKPFLFLPVLFLVGAPAFFQQSQSTPNPPASTQLAPIPAEYVNMTNPVKPTPESLARAKQIYGWDCALCHGDPVRPHSPLEESFYPRPPQFMSDAADMGDQDNYYITQHGIRWSGMPAWKDVLSDQDIWEVVTFIGHMNNLPLDVKAVFALQGAPPAAVPTKKPTKNK